VFLFIFPCQFLWSTSSFERRSIHLLLLIINVQVSLHIRGPINFSTFAVYHRSSSSKEKREAEPEPEPEAKSHPLAQYFPGLHRHKRGHVHRHDRRDPEAKVVTVTETVYSTSTRLNQQLQATAGSISSAAPASSASSPPSNGESSNTGTTINGSYAWARDTYYNAATGEADNIIFMNHQGGTNGSGVWDSCFGNSLSFAAADGCHGAASPQTLGAVTIPSDNELAIFSAQQCGDCGYVRPGSPAYRGFSTSSETLFLMEFEMPRDPGSGFNVDMSAAWFLNAQIPRTLQYGNAACSCWTSGCGEFDAFEILSTGSNFLTATLHSWQGTGNQYGGGGCSDYINRPLTSSMKAVVYFNSASSSIEIYTLPSTVTFDVGLTDTEVQSWFTGAASPVNIGG